MVESKKKTEKKIEENKATFPAQTFVNQWGFIHLSPKAIEAFGATKGQKTPITIDLSEGALIIKKA